VLFGGGTGGDVNMAGKMKKMGTFRTLSDCDQARTLLEGSGIACLVKNEFAANTAGAGPLAPLPFALPELWVLDDAQEKDA
jgi:hypothetical protein